MHVSNAIRSISYYKKKSFLRNLSILQELESYQKFVLNRNQDNFKDNVYFTGRCLEECRRSFNHVHLEKVTLKITPIQALHLSDVKVKYFDFWRGKKLRVVMSYVTTKSYVMFIILN